MIIIPRGACPHCWSWLTYIDDLDGERLACVTGCARYAMPCEAQEVPDPEPEAGPDDEPLPE